MARAANTAMTRRVAAGNQTPRRSDSGCSDALRSFDATQTGETGGEVLASNNSFDVMRRSSVQSPILQASAALSHPPADASRSRGGHPTKRPGHAAPLDQILQYFLVLQRVHRAPEALMSDRQKLIGLNKPPEGRLDQLLAVAEIVEDL